MLTIDTVTLVLTLGDEQLYTTLSPRDAGGNRPNVHDFIAKLLSLDETVSAMNTGGKRSVIIPITDSENQENENGKCRK